MAQDRNEHVVDRFEELLFDGVRHVGVNHMPIQRFVVLPIELSNHDGGGVGRSVGLYAGVRRDRVRDCAFQGRIICVGHDKGEVTVKTAAEFRRNRHSVGVELAL